MRYDDYDGLDYESAVEVAGAEWLGWDLSEIRRLEAAGYNFKWAVAPSDGGSVIDDVTISKVVTGRTHTARRDHRDGMVSAGQRYHVTTIRFCDPKTRKSYHRHQKTLVTR